MSSSEKVKRWRKKTKERIVKAMGGACQCCGYNRCHAALELHHIDPAQKDLSFGKIRANPKNWKSIVGELRKCILLCSNCHKEVHAGITDLPNLFQTFDEKFVEYRIDKSIAEPCPVCGNLKPQWYKTCSPQCAGKRARKVKWDSIDLEFLLSQYSLSEIGRQLGVSGNAVKKRAKKLKLL